MATSPIQVNYLGYFLLLVWKDGLLDWRSSSVSFAHTNGVPRKFQLNRPFSWAHCPLPESEAMVSEAPRVQYALVVLTIIARCRIRQSLWGKILQAIPEAILVLKANASNFHTKGS